MDWKEKLKARLRMGWTKCASARTAKGDSVTSRHPEACQWCLLAAAFIEHSDEGIARLDVVLKKRGYVGTADDRVVDFNDNPKTTLEDVFKLIDEA